MHILACIHLPRPLSIKKTALTRVCCPYTLFVVTAQGLHFVFPLRILFYFPPVHPRGTLLLAAVVAVLLLLLYER